MQNVQTLLDLGFERFPEWDYSDPITKHYRKEMNGKVFRAYEVSCNGPVYVMMGEVSTKDGKVKSWMDCCSNGSVERKMEKCMQNRDKKPLTVKDLLFGLEVRELNKFNQ